MLTTRLAVFFDVSLSTCWIHRGGELLGVGLVRFAGWFNKSAEAGEEVYSNVQR